MSTIVTITFSPCIDRFASVASLIPGKKLKCCNEKLQPGGGGINVARAIKKLGGDAIALYPSGGYTGKFFNELLQKEGIPSLIVETIHGTRENVIVQDSSTGLQYRFGMPSLPLEETEWQQILSSLEKMNEVQYIVVSGSLPPGVPNDIFRRLGHIARQKNAMLVADTSGEALRKVVETDIFLLKPNLGELSSLVNKEYLETHEVIPAAQEVICKGKCQVMLVSMGEGGALLISKDLVRNISAPNVQIKSTVGAGDSMVAGMVLNLSRGKGLEESARYGVAAGTAATMNPGTELCLQKDTDRLFSLMEQQTG